MKKMYLNPEAMILVIADEDILTASLTEKVNLLGDDDGEFFSKMFQ